ncbi:MAG: TetR/AcrR family transcriptional regulator [Marmoricola sp.]
MPPRAAPLSRDERRSAILGALVPLLVERGGEVSTREVAEAAGVAEGTIFRVFADKRELMLAAAEEAINPAHGQEELEVALAGLTDLRAKVLVAVEGVLARMRLTMSVMFAIRQHLMAAHAEQHQEHQHKPGPPAFVLAAQEDLHRRLTTLFMPHRDELAVEPAVAAAALRSLILGSSRPELGMAPVLTPDQIADLLLGGVLRKGDACCSA